MNRQKVRAVVVTRDRRELLSRCLQAIAAQTHPVDIIIVVDNASSDGSQNFIQEQQWSKTLSIRWLRLEENTGGAGGFHKGMKEALSYGEGLIWLMDDDGFPATDCLELLLEHMDENAFIGPLVISDQDHVTLSFPIRIPGTLKTIPLANDVFLQGKKVLDGVLLPFNGVLVTSKIVEKYGLPKKEMFIWGDETEYLLRLKHNNIKISTIICAKFYHPKPFLTGELMFFGKLRFNDTDSPVKLYCFVRNSIYNWKKYYGYKYSFLFLFKPIWFYIFTKPSMRKLLISLFGIFHGYTNNFSHHKIYLQQNYRGYKKNENTVI